MTLPKFTAVGSVFEIAPGVVEDQLDGSAVAFTANITADTLVTYGGNLEKFRTEYTTPVAEDGSFTVELPAEDAGWNFTGLQWTVEFRIRDYPGSAGWNVMRRWVIDAATDGAVVNLASVAPVPGVSITGMGGLPPQGGHAGEVLTTDGSRPSWTPGGTGGGGVTNLSTTRTATQVVVVASGSDATVPAADASNAGVMTAAMQNKLAAIEPSADVTDTANVTAAGAVMTTSKNVANGVAGLDGSGLVPSALVPGVAPEVIEVANFAALPGTGVSNKIYVSTATSGPDLGRQWRWGGTSYWVISPSPGSTDAVSEGSLNLYYTNARADARVAAGITGKLDTTAAPELVRDTMGTGLVAGTNITITPSDVGDTITIATTGGSTLTDDGTGLFIVGTGGSSSLTDDGTGLFIIT